MKGSQTVPQEGKAVRGKLLNVTQAGEMISRGRDWFYRNMKNKTLPFPWFLMGPGKRMMDSADIDDWLRTRKVPAGAMPGDI